MFLKKLDCYKVRKNNNTGILIAVYCLQKPPLENTPIVYAFTSCTILDNGQYPIFVNECKTACTPAELFDQQEHLANVPKYWLPARVTTTSRKLLIPVWSPLPPPPPKPKRRRKSSCIGTHWSGLTHQLYI